MTLRLRPAKRQREDLAAIAELTNEQLKSIESRFLALDLTSPLQLRPENLVQHAESVDKERAQALIRQLLSLTTLARRYRVSVGEICAAIGDAVNGNWSSRADAVEQLLKTKAVRLTANAIELSYDYANLIRHIRILTDVRPLFDEGGEKIEAAVVSHTMRVNFDSADGEHELSLVLDIKDLKNLKESCERALKKSATAKNVLAGIPTIVSGDTEED